MVKAGIRNRSGNKVTGRVLYDCAVSMGIPVLFTVFMEIVDNILGVVTADTMGRFADAAFSLDLKTGVGNGLFLIICIIAIVFVVPLLELAGSFSMLKRSLRHDNLVIDHYLAKEPEAAMDCRDKEMQCQLEDEPLTMRIWWVRICSKALALPICTAYLLYRTGRVDRLLTVMLFVLAGIKLTVPVLFKNRLAAYDRAEQTYQARRRSLERDMAMNCLSIRMLGIQKPILERLRRLSEDYYRETDRVRIADQTMAERSGDFVGSLMRLFLVAAAAIMIAAGRITPGGLAAMLIYYDVVQSLMTDVGEIIQNYPLMMNAAAVVGKFYQDQETAFGTAVEHIESINGEGIGLAFSDREVFRGKDFLILAGEKIGVCGENGSGKSTFGKILASLIRQYHGKITIGGTPYNTVDPENWRRLIAYVPQKPWLFDATVRENIMMGDFDDGSGRAEQMMRDFGILSIADKTLPEAGCLSGGEKQKVSIIRGLLKKSELLILDEPTNNLDQESVLMLTNYIRKTKQTVIIISHDELLLNEMDRRICF